MGDTKSKPGLAARVSRPLLAGALAAGASAPATVLGDTFLRLDQIPGESQDSKHKGEIEILSYTQSFRNTGSATGGGGGGAGKVICGDVTVLKNIDKSSPKLIEATATAKHIRDGVITFRTAGGNPHEYYKVKMTDILVTAVDQTDQPDPSRIVERVTFSSAKFEFEYVPQDEAGKPGQAVKFTFDCKTQKAG